MSAPAAVNAAPVASWRTVLRKVWFAVLFMLVGALLTLLSHPRETIAQVVAGWRSVCS
jgi:hypothetical protein